MNCSASDCPDVLTPFETTHQVQIKIYPNRHASDLTMSGRRPGNRSSFLLFIIISLVIENLPNRIYSAWMVMPEPGVTEPICHMGIARAFASA